jgi:hypothetical protein
MAAEQKQQHDEDKNDWLGHLVRLGLMTWAIGVITANYMGMFKQSIDVTFSASILSSMAASYGLQVGRNTAKKEDKPKVDETTPSLPKK